MNTFGIGDIHGGLRALHQILEKANIQKTDKLIFLGDYVDGWSESPQLIDYLIGLSKTNNCIFIRGNHDQLFLDYLQNDYENLNEKKWFQHGGKATVDAYKKVSLATKIKHIDFLKSLQNYYLDSQNRLFVHAGFTNVNGVDYEFFPKLFYWDRTLWETAIALDEKIQKDSVLYPKRFNLYKEIYIGHTPTTRINSAVPVHKASVWNIDTGAAFTGKLTIMDIDTKEFWQSDNLPDLYPNEVGRVI
ncbi:MAG: serine/threonine protein phosphatase [Flavobacterium sp.]|nr:serine/threonine protein phosphatase [Flavobacterium sp.]